MGWILMQPDDPAASVSALADPQISLGTSLFSGWRIVAPSKPFLIILDLRPSSVVGVKSYLVTISPPCTDPMQ